MAKPSGRAPEAVGVDTESRPKRFMKSALAILGETGRTDFTVLEVVERSKTSLRSFYQHFSTKDELLLALIDAIMSESTRKWRDGHGRPAEPGGDAGAHRPHLHTRRIHHPGQGQSGPDVLQRPPGGVVAPRIRARALPRARADQGHHQPRHRRRLISGRPRRRRHGGADHAMLRWAPCACRCWAPN